MVDLFCDHAQVSQNSCCFFFCFFCFSLKVICSKGPANSELCVFAFNALSVSV